MNETATETVDTHSATEAPPPEAVTFADVAAASAEAQAEPRWMRRLVTTTLTETAVADLGREMAQEEADLEALETERKNVNADLRERIAETKLKIKGLREAIRAGKGTSEIDVREVPNESTGGTDLVGRDGMVYIAAGMSQARQLSLADAAKANGSTSESDDDDSADDLEDDDESPDLEDRLARALADSDPPSDPAQTDITSPDAILASAAPEDETAADAPKAKRSRRRKTVEG